MKCHHKLHSVLERKKNWIYTKSKADSWEKSKQIIFTLETLKIWNVKMCMQNLDWQFADIHNTWTATASDLCIYTVRGAAGRFIKLKAASEMKWAFSKQRHLFNPNWVSYCSNEFKWFPLWRDIHYRHISIVNQGHGWIIKAILRRVF